MATGKPEISNCIVAVIDVLGQSEKMLQVRWMPLDKRGAKLAARIANETSIRNRSLRSAFTSAFEKASHPTKETVNMLPKGLRRYAIEGIRHVIYSFSDTIVVAVPLQVDDHVFRVTFAIHMLFNAISTFFVLTLAEGIFLRIGIDVGMTLIFPDGEVSGAALVEAYRLESKVAQFPRIVLGLGVLALFQSLRDLTQDIVETESRDVIMDGLRDCVRVMETDSDDDVMFLDYLSLFQSSDLLPEVKQALQQSYKVIRKEFYKYSKRGNHKIGGRYAQMMKYYEARINR